MIKIQTWLLIMQLLLHFMTIISCSVVRELVCFMLVKRKDIFAMRGARYYETWEIFE